MMANSKYRGGPTGKWAERIQLVKEYMEEDGAFMNDDTVRARWGVRKTFIRSVVMQLKHKVQGPRGNVKLEPLSKAGRQAVYGNVAVLAEYGLTEEEACRAMGIRPEELAALRDKDLQEASLTKRPGRKTVRKAVGNDAPGNGKKAVKDQSLRPPKAAKLRGQGQDDYARRILGLGVSDQTAGWLANIGWFHVYADNEPLQGLLEKLSKKFSLKRKLDGMEALDALLRLGWPRRKAESVVSAATVEHGGEA